MTMMTSAVMRRFSNYLPACFRFIFIPFAEDHETASLQAEVASEGKQLSCVFLC